MKNPEEPSPATPDPLPKGVPSPAPNAPMPAREEALPGAAPGRWGRRAIIAFTALAALAAIFYLEENWRGKSAWENARKTLEAQQEKLDWDAYMPPPVPDEQNFFKAPKMQDWFTGSGSNELTARLSLHGFAALASHLANSNASVVVTELLLRPPETNAANPGAVAPEPEILPRIIVEKSSLGEAIRRLAERANLKVAIDPQVSAGRPGPDGKPTPPVYVSGQWTNVSAASVLMTLLCNNNLLWVDDPANGPALIKNAGVPGDVELANREFVLIMIRNAIGPVGETAEGFPLSGLPLLQTPPRRLSIAADSVPTQKELARLFPGTNSLLIEPAGNSLRVSLMVVPVPAADYLVWSDQFSPEFDKIRDAAKRPFARLDGNYQQLYKAPAPNFLALRAVALRLAGRAKAFLMRGEPEKALGELTLLHALRGSLEGKPAGKPMTLAGAAADAGIAAVYAETVDYGLRWQMWREADLTALQEQLGGIDLVSPVWSAMESTRAGDCRLLETGGRSEMAHIFDIGPRQGSFWQKIKSPSRMALQLMPRGVLEQNMARLAVLDQKMIDAVDRVQDIVRPHQVDAAQAQISADLLLHRRSFYSYLARNIIAPMETRLKTTALAQSAVNQALLVCALERFRLARGQYPVTLPELTPQFIALLPQDPINGESFQYRAGPAHFLLYSVGWDEKDDHGAPLNAAGEGDWVWDRF